MRRGDVGVPYRARQAESALWACVGFVAGMVATGFFLYSLANGGGA